MTQDPKAYTSALCWQGDCDKCPGLLATVSAVVKRCRCRCHEAKS